ncbi:MAG: hypothetical protein GXO63_01970 [Candidatus Micrarchaeota archaeon]|nr:hypothetical protein [Candidatus Micrarchaeota archaeon]
MRGIGAAFLKGLKEYYTSRTYLLGLLMNFLLFGFIFIFFWTTVLGEKGLEAAAYIFFAQLLFFSSPRSGRTITKEILKGTYDQRLLKPVHPLIQFFFEDLGKSTMIFLLFFAVLIPIFFVLNVSINFLILFPAFMLAYTLSFLFYMILGTFAFWVGETRYFFWFSGKLVLTNVLLPREYVPGFFLPIYDILPGKFIVYYPTKMVLSGLFSVEPLLYFLFLLIILRIIYHYGERKLTVYGG